MKEALKPMAIMEMMVDKLQEKYADHKPKAEGIIQFHLTHNEEKIDCYINSDNTKLQFVEGIANDPTVTIKSTFYNWLDLAGGKLNPILGVVTRKLKFNGDISFFKILPKKDFKQSLNIPKDPVTKFEKNPQKHWSIPQKVVVLNASPRGKNGYTDFYLKPFINGINKKSKPEVVYLSDYKIHPCIGCFSCWMNKPGECVYHKKDDFIALANIMSTADLIVYAFPIYADGMPGILKNYFDRSVSRAYPYMINGINGVRHPRRFIKENQCMIVFSICGFFEDKNFDPVRAFFKALAHNRHCPVVGEIYRTTAVGLFGNPFLHKMLNNVTDALESAGEEVVMTGKIKRKTLKVITQKISGSKEDITKINEWWNDKKGSMDLNY